MLKEKIKTKNIIQVLIVLVFLAFLLIIAINQNKKEEVDDSFKYNFKNELLKAEVDENLIIPSIYEEDNAVFMFKQKEGSSYLSVISIENTDKTKECNTLLMNYKASLDENYKTNILYNETIDNVSYLNFSLVDSQKNTINVYTKAESNGKYTLMSTLFLVYNKDVTENNALQRTFNSLTFK